MAGAIEAILFASGSPVKIEKISQVLEVTEDFTNEVIEILLEKYSSVNSGINLVKLNDSLQFCTNPVFIIPVRNILELKKNTPLSPAAMEVLALVAYNEPVTKAFVEQVRGVDCSGVLGSLMQKELIEERGRLELPGRPLLYGTTDVFLRSFGVENLGQLPPIPQEEEKIKEQSGESPEEIKD